MNIKESCDDWVLDFNHQNDIELTDEEKECVKNILHTAGDSLGVILNIADEEEELRNKILQVITAIYLDARSRMQVAVEFTILNQAILSPLQKGFTDEDLFGENLTNSLKATLKEDEKGIVNEYLNPKKDEEDEEEENDSNH